MKRGLIGRLTAALALGAASIAPAHAQSVESHFDNVLGSEVRAPRDLTARYDTPLAQRVAMLAAGDQGRIGVAAIDLTSGQVISILGDQRFPMASTSKIAIAATFMEGVEQGRWTLSSEFPLLIPVQSPRFSSARAPVRPGSYMTAYDLIDLMITRSSNPATDALLAAVGGPAAVNDWARRNGIQDFTLTRDIATLVRDDGEVDPASRIDIRDSATPMAMAQLLAGLHQGRFLSARSRQVILDAMERCKTGTRRIPALLPLTARVQHKTGSLNNTSSDIGIFRLADGRPIAVAIYVTGQGTRLNRERRIAEIARGIYDGYSTFSGTGAAWVRASQ